MTAPDRVETERLALHRPVIGDHDAIHAMVQQANVGRFLGNSTSFEESFKRVLRNEGCWSFFGYGPYIVEEKTSGAFVGQCGLFHGRRGLGGDFDPYPEAGWVTHPDHWGKGYALEAMAAILELGDRELGIERTVAIISPDNAPSLALAGKLDFDPIGNAEYEGKTVERFARMRP